MSNLPPVVINLSAVGADEVRQAFKSIEDSAKRLEESLSKATKGGTEKRKRERKTETDHATREEQKRTKQNEREEAKRTALANREAKKREAAKEREFQKLVRWAEKAAQDEIRIEKRKNAQIELENKRASAARQRFFQKVSNDAMNSIRGTVGTAMRLAGAVTAIGGGFTIGDAVGSAVRNSATAQSIALQSGSAVGKKGSVSKEKVLKTAERLATTQGFSTEEALGAVGQFIAKTGDADMALKTIEDLGELANATDADLKDLATSAGLAFNADKTMGAEKLMKIMRQLSAQGREGALDMRDLAGSLSRITATANQFKGDLFQNINTLGGLAQLSMAKGTATSPAEATESVASLSQDIAGNEQDFQKAGIQIKDKYGQLLDPEQIIRNAVFSTAADGTKLQKLFGRRSFRAVQGYATEFQKNYAEARASGKSEEEARQIGLDKASELLKTFTDAELSKQQVEKEAAIRKEEADKKMAIVMEQLRTEVGNRLVPELIKLIPTLQQLIPHIANLTEKFIKLVEWIGKNPFQAAVAGLGAVIAKAFITEIAAAALQKVISEQMALAFAGSAGSVAALGAAATAAALSIKGFAEGMDILNSGETGDQADTVVRDAVKGEKYARNRIEEVEDQGTGVLGDLKRFAIGTFATAEMGIGTVTDPILGTKIHDEGRQLYKDTATNQAIAAQLNSQSIEERKAEAAERAAKALERAAKKLEETRIGPPPPPSNSGKPPTSDGNH